MPPPRWALSNLTVEDGEDGCTITAYTFHACHLWCRLTTIEPQEHIIPYVVRGVALHSNKRYCFVSYIDIEQEEAGDTYVHTFIVTPWPNHQTRWYYFHGRIGGTISPSTSGIFKHTHTLPPWGPPVWMACPFQQDVLLGAGINVDWESARSQYPVTLDDRIGENISTRWYNDKYLVCRYGLVWNTTNIPEGSLIVGAYMRRYGYYITHPNDKDFDCIWVNGNAWDGGLGDYWFQRWNSWTEVVASTHVVTTQTSRRWRNIYLTDAGLAAIVPGGLTKMISKTDVDNDDEESGTEQRDYYWYGKQTGTYAQNLYVQYRPPRE